MQLHQELFSSETTPPDIEMGFHLYLKILAWKYSRAKRSELLAEQAQESQHLLIACWGY